MSLSIKVALSQFYYKITDKMFILCNIYGPKLIIVHLPHILKLYAQIIFYTNHVWINESIEIDLL